MKALDIPRLFHSILSPRAKVDAGRISGMGLLAVKIAQIYALRPDLLEESKCIELSRLLEKAESLSGQEFDSRWKQVASARLADSLDRFDRKPIASASLGQVHRGVLKDGSVVALKILKRDLRDDFLNDVSHMRKWLTWALRFYPKLRRLADPMDALDAVERQTLCEMDLTAEIRGAARLRTLADEAVAQLAHLKMLHFPSYHSALGDERLLVSGFVEGRTLASWLESGELDYQAILDLFRIHGYYLFVRGEFHGDLHPGNVILHEGRFWFLDNANIETVPRDFAAGLFRMMVLLGQGDLARAADALAGVSLQSLSASRHAAFRSSFISLYQDFTNRPTGEISLTRQMMHTIRMAVNCGMTFPRGAFPLIKSLMYLDGMVIKAAPQAKLLRDVAKFEGDFEFSAPGSPILPTSP